MGRKAPVVREKAPTVRITPRMAAEAKVSECWLHYRALYDVVHVMM